MNNIKLIIEKLFKISLFLSAMFLLVVRSVAFSFYPTDYKHVFLTAAILGLLFLFFMARVKLKIFAKTFLTFVFLATALLMFITPYFKIEFDYQLI